MARSRRETTISIRKFIIFHHSSGKSVRNIAKSVNLSNSTVQYVIKRFKEENRIENKQDKDPKHTVLNIRFCCLYNCPQNLKTPPQSPDLNPIEHIWRELEVRARKHDIKTKSELKTVMMEKRMNIHAEITKKLAKSIPKRLKAVVDAKGYPTKY
ncbi:hypothetical protein AVEN_228217-1 [Araneus ventricosus]|uniref:Uncharacterized protein n=1 Tax=Araneus ventricosus TaxID=182803 RepID=A0A4Y2IHS4_ARAVE|nr:hypothetical protein AVEN_228217-1 [Araneus ventricosus]